MCIRDRLKAWCIYNKQGEDLLPQRSFDLGDMIELCGAQGMHGESSRTKERIRFIALHSTTHGNLNQYSKNTAHPKEQPIKISLTTIVNYVRLFVMLNSPGQKRGKLRNPQYCVYRSFP